MCLYHHPRGLATLFYDGTSIYLETQDTQEDFISWALCKSGYHAMTNTEFGFRISTFDYINRVYVTTGIPLLW